MDIHVASGQKKILHLEEIKGSQIKKRVIGYDNRNNKRGPDMAQECSFCRQRPGYYVSLHGHDICAEWLKAEEQRLSTDENEEGQ